MPTQGRLRKSSSGTPTGVRQGLVAHLDEFDADPVGRRHVAEQTAGGELPGFHREARSPGADGLSERPEVTVVGVAEVVRTPLVVA